MSLLFMDGFDDGNQALKWSIWSGSNDLSGSFGRNGTGVRYDGNAAGLAEIVFPAGYATVVIGFAFQMVGSADSSVNNVQCLEGGTLHTNLRFLGGDGSIQIRRSTTVVATTAAGVFTPGVWHYLEVKVTTHDTTGVVEIRVDGSVVHTFNGDTRNGGTSGVVDRVNFGANSGSAQNFYMDDLYMLNTSGSINNDYLGDCVVETLKPNGNGNYSQWLGSDGNNTDNYLLVDDAPTPDADTTYVVETTNTEKDSYAHSDLTASSGANVYGVQSTIRARHDGAGGTARALHRRSSTDSFGAAFTPASSYTCHKTIWEQDPAAGPGAWTVTNVNASEFGYELVS